MFEGKRVLAILNPASGKGKGDALAERLEETVLAHGAAAVEVRPTRGPKDALEWAAGAADDGHELLIVGGGDGTVTAVAHGVHRSGSRLPIGIVPLGTGNGMARVLGLPLEPGETLDALAGGRLVDVDAVEVRSHDALALLFLGAGLDARINRDADAEQKARLGWFAYVRAAVDNLRRATNHELTVWLDGEQSRFSGHTVSVLNATRLDVMGIRVGPDARPDDGTLKVTVLRSPRLLVSLGQLLRLVGKESSRSELRSARLVRVEATPPLPVQIDGDVIGQTPLEAQVVSGALRFIAAADYEAE